MHNALLLDFYCHVLFWKTTLISTIKICTIVLFFLEKWVHFIKFKFNLPSIFTRRKNSKKEKRIIKKKFNNINKLNKIHNQWFFVI